ncbi:MAG: hypothetical protein QOG68_1226, partial [Solirubrobacteraceae bacterium]|nr:hypothetical protein [Solirubrobacteraceae bacterium]
MIGARRSRSSSLMGFVITAVIAVPSFAFVMERTLNNTPKQRMELSRSSGAVSITNSQDGQAILTAPPMIPGTTTSGSVHIVNTGDGSESLKLDSNTPTDQPGPGGGNLSERLTLRVEDVSPGGAPITIYDGSLTGLHLADLGTLAKGEDRTYRFVVTFPDGGANGADNAFQGSSASIGFTWTAGAAGPAAPPADAPLSDQVTGDTPLAYWPLDGSASTMADATGQHGGAFADSVTTDADTAPGGGHGAWFDGQTGSASADSVPAPTDAYTIEAWIRASTSGNMMILEHAGGG